MEKEKKTNLKLIIVLSIILVAVIAFGLWAWSKYTTTVSGTAEASIAQWHFEANGQVDNLGTFNLAQNTKYTTIDSHQNVDDNRIAPGTSGYFVIDIDASESANRTNGKKSEVALKYTVTLNNFKFKPTNLHFYSDPTRNTQIDSTTSSDTTVVLNGSIARTDVTTQQNIYIYWEWPYETGQIESPTEASNQAVANNDAIDTQDGVNAKKCTFDITVVGTQANPSEAEVRTYNPTTPKN